MLMLFQVARMPSRNFMAGLAALVTILAVISGNSRLVTGRGLVDSSPTGKHFTEDVGNNSSVKFPLVGSWTVTNLVGDTISAHCYSQLTDLGTDELSPGAVLYQQFAAQPYFAEVWSCQFKWASSQGPLEADFEVWAHDYQTGYLWGCDDCYWRVQADGFYFQNTEGLWWRQWPWNPWNSARKH